MNTNYLVRVSCSLNWYGKQINLMIITKIFELSMNQNNYELVLIRYLFFFSGQSLKMVGNFCATDLIELV